LKSLLSCFLSFSNFKVDRRNERNLKRIKQEDFLTETLSRLKVVPNPQLLKKGRKKI
jgi:hypothetical protein